MATGVASWVKTPASANATADQNVNAAEGMAPAQVNDGMRAMMSSVAMWRDDLTGIVTTGNATAYAVTSSQGFASLAALNGRRIAIIPHVSSGAAPTLSVDGLAPRPIRLQTGTAPSSAAFVQGSPSELLYNDANGEFLAYGSAAGIPTGAIMPYAGSVAPAGWHLCCGQAISRTTYAALFAVCSTTYGLGTGGDGTTFGTPDLRGRVIAGLDNVGGFGFAGRISPAGANFDGTVLGNSGGAQSMALALAHLPNFAPGFTGGNPVTVGLNDPNNATLTNTGVFRVSLSGAGGANFFSDTQGVTIPTPTGTVGSINGGQTQQGYSILSPAMTLNYIIKF